LVMSFLGSGRSRVIGALAGFVGLLVLPFTPLMGFLSRFQSGGVNTLGGRTSIWGSAFDLLISDPEYLLIGVGSGGAGRVLGGHAPDPVTLLAAQVFSSNQVTLRVNLHSSFFEWELSYGLVGLTLALFVLVSLAVKASFL